MLSCELGGKGGEPRTVLTNAPADKGKKHKKGLTSKAETVTGEAKTENNFKA